MQNLSTACESVQNFWQNLPDGYRYGFNGMEKDDEIKGDGNSYDFGARIYDARIGRWLSTDPLETKYPALSPYSFAGNSPILFVDTKGEDILIHYIDEDGNNAYYEYGSGIKMPRDKFVRATVRTLDKIQRRGADTQGIIPYLIQSAEPVIISLPESFESMFALAMVVGPAGIAWHPQAGIVTSDGEKHNPAGGLLHELAEVYYIKADPEGHVAELNKIIHPVIYLEGEDIKSGISTVELTNYLDKQKEACGNYDTYGDMWIIQNVEPEFDKAFNQKSRTDHGGLMLLTKGPFSKNGVTGAEYKSGAKVRDKYNEKRKEDAIKIVSEKVGKQKNRGI